jgi:phosphoribosylformylglycinamidine (FGAM) synthase-like amidotransferase family enzyme
MKFPDKTLKFNFNHSPKAINSLITQSACVYLDLLPHVKRILTEIYAGNHIFNNFQNHDYLFIKLKD